MRISVEAEITWLRILLQIHREHAVSRGIEYERQG